MLLSPNPIQDKVIEKKLKLKAVDRSLVVTVGVGSWLTPVGNGTCGPTTNT